MSGANQCLDLMSVTNLLMMLANLAFLAFLAFAKYGRRAKYYDHAVRILEEEQGEWFVNFIVESEISSLFHRGRYARGVPAAGPRAYDLGESESESESGDSDGDKGSRQVDPDSSGSRDSLADDTAQQTADTDSDSATERPLRRGHRLPKRKAKPVRHSY
jgi:hypothetical protein